MIHTDAGPATEVALLAGVRGPVANFVGFGLPRLRPALRRPPLRPPLPQLPPVNHPPHPLLPVARQRHLPVLLPQAQQVLGEGLQVS